MAKTSKFVLKIGAFERHELNLTPRDAARAATQIARGTFVRTKSIHEQPDNARPGRAVTLTDDKGNVVMECRPSVYGQRNKKHTRTYAACDVAPKFRALLLRSRKKPAKRGGLGAAAKDIEAAVHACQLYIGKGLTMRVSDEQKLYNRMNKKIAAVAKKRGMDEGEAYRQIMNEAKRRGGITPMPGKDI